MQILILTWACFDLFLLQIHKERGQALLEFLTPEDASAALSFDGRSFAGSILKIRRPKDFIELTVRIYFHLSFKLYAFSLHYYILIFGCLTVLSYEILLSMHVFRILTLL